jgi:16S rRNA (adenine1518-N6/adenine1519-N6)-dimethyltransferase
MKLQPKKSLGQHFLNSPHVLEQIIGAANIKTGENVLEIGPGTGILTSALIGVGANVIAVEKDDRAYELLKEKFSKEIADERLKLIHGDILDEKIFSSEQGRESQSLLGESDSSFALVANIPYYITGAILEKFLEHGPRPSRMVLLVQKEVAERIVARPPDGKKSDGTRNDRGKESILSISVKAFGTPKIIAKVPRGAFTPPPTVDSAILSIKDISGTNFQSHIHIKKFFQIVRAGFAHKRKFLIRNLETVAGAEELGAIWNNLGLDEKVRAEDLTIEQWIGITEPLLEKS